MRLLNYNIHRGQGADGRYSLSRTLSVISAEQPDLICLQEVDVNCKRSNWHHQPTLLAERLEMPFAAYAFVQPLREGGSGNLILSRWPFSFELAINLRFRQRKHRGAQVVGIETPVGLLHLVNLHLGLSAKERRWQMEQLLAQSIFADIEVPLLMSGDFNDWRNTLANRCLRPKGLEQLTDPPSRFRSYPAYFAITAVDKAFHRGPIRVSQTRMVCDRTARRASSHLPVVVDFEIEVAKMQKV
jgi:endonuclease/exonuclease/phosphatase family metal-dependent hydrolase